MKHLNNHQTWIKLLTAFWLIVAIQFGVASPISAADELPDTFQKCESGTQDLNVEFLLEQDSFSDFQKLLCANYSHFTPVTVDLKLLSTPPSEDWPDESRISSWRNIIAYQYYLSSLRTLS